MNNYNTNSWKEPYNQKISAKYIISDPDYQRAVDMNRVKKIVSEFDPNLVNPIKVSKRNGKLYVFDGQHTLAALKLKHQSDDIKVDCRVYEGLTKEQEAWIFSQQTGISRQVDTNAKFKALWVSGDEDICEWKIATERLGIKMDFSKGKARFKIVACSKAYKVWKELSPLQYREILEVILEAWSGEAFSFNTEILGGMLEFYKRYYGEFKKEILAKQLNKVSPMYIIREGKLSSITGDRKYARQIVEAYNKKLRNNRIDPKE